MSGVCRVRLFESSAEIISGVAGGQGGTTVRLKEQIIAQYYMEKLTLIII
jgi:hypothetical protein